MRNLHAAIMNLPTGIVTDKEDEYLRGFRQGHKSARHQAAELAAAHDAGRQELVEALKDARFIVEEYGQEMGAGPLSGIGEALKRYDALIAKHGEQA
jgi:hypothetical protein